MGEARCTAGRTDSSSHTRNSPNPEHEGRKKQKNGDATRLAIVKETSKDQEIKHVTTKSETTDELRRVLVLMRHTNQHINGINILI